MVSLKNYIIKNFMENSHNIFYVGTFPEYLIKTDQKLSRRNYIKYIKLHICNI